MAHKYKGLIIVSIVGVILAIALLLIGGSMAGWDIAAWFDIETSKYLQMSIVGIVILIVTWMGFAANNYYNKHMRK